MQLLDSIYYNLYQYAIKNDGIIPLNERELRYLSHFNSDYFDILSILSSLDESQLKQIKVLGKYDTLNDYLIAYINLDEKALANEKILNLFWDKVAFPFIKDKCQKITKAIAKELNLKAEGFLLNEAYEYCQYKKIDLVFNKKGLSPIHFINMVSKGNFSFDELVEKSSNSEAIVSSIIEQKISTNTVEKALNSETALKVKEEKLPENEHIDEKTPSIDDDFFTLNGIGDGMVFVFSDLKKLNATKLTTIWNRTQKEANRAKLSNAWESIRLILEQAGNKNPGRIIGKWEKDYGYQALIELSKYVKNFTQISPNITGLMIAKLKEFSKGKESPDNVTSKLRLRL